MCQDISNLASAGAARSGAHPIKLQALLAFVVALGLPLGYAHAQSATVIERIAWLAGCWSRATATSTVEEQWMTPRGGAMLGMSRTVTNGAVREYEHLRIFTAGDTLVYGALPSRQQYAEFRSTSITSNEIVFENLAHDFPQRVAYQRVSRDSIVAYIEGPGAAATAPRRVNFPFVRTACPGGPS